MSTTTEYSLNDRFDPTAGAAYLSGNQALVRLLLVQRELDRRAGLNTAGYVSGYRGSPLAALDLELGREAERLAAAGVHVEPGVNEELAATALWGTQQAALFDGRRHDGVFGLWYGKGPGVDRASDALKHGNHIGASRHGGVLVAAGDDHAGSSSSLAHQSEPVLVHCGIPVLYPSDVQDYLDLGIYGWALSRYSGRWVGLKCVTDTVNASATVDLALDRVPLVEVDEPGDDRWAVWGATGAALERRMLGPGLDAVLRFARTNPIDRVAFGVRGPARIGIVTAGKAYRDVREALTALGIDEPAAVRIGLAVYKVGMTWPLEPTGLRRFAAGCERLVVVEEKRPLLQEQVALTLYNEAGAPRLAGKLDFDGRPLFADSGELDPVTVATALARVLELEPPVKASRIFLPLSAGSLQRRPAFCAGCPHNTSTVVPEGSIAMGGIGCHGMAALMPERRTFGYTQMGGEGATWIGAHRFVHEDHVFQNLGDGTFTHSGSLAVRAAVAARANITYKILVNGAVAMTGGQPVEGHGDLATGELAGDIARQVLAERVARAVVVADDPDALSRAGLPDGVAVRHRDELALVQEELRATPGVTVLLYVQACSAEARRLRKRGRFPEPEQRVYINPEVCEGCGDCGVQSNCIAVEPLETAFGRKRRINQDSCNKDFTCLKGYCPSFAVVTGRRRKHTPDLHRISQLAADLPEPEVAGTRRPCNVLISGIGGTGIVTAGAVLGTAAHLEGKAAVGYDVTGSAQKNGAVESHLRIADDRRELFSPSVPAGSVDLLLAADPVSATAAGVLAKLSPERTSAVLNTHVAPTAAFAADPDLDLGTSAMDAALGGVVTADRIHRLDATGLAERLFGEPFAANILLLGYAAQLGLLPVGLAALRRAIELNGARVQLNLSILDAGRVAAHDPEVFRAAVDGRGTAEPAATDEPDLAATVEHRAADLEAYQDRRYADRYRAAVHRVQAREQEVTGGASGELTAAVAHTLHRLMAYKDEYEVARLWTDRRTRDALDEMFEPGYRVSLNLAPQLLWPKDPVTGRSRKATFGPWVFPLLRMIRRFGRLRGTPLDLPGRTRHRRRERELLAALERDLDRIERDLSPDNHHLAVQLADIPARIRGFGEIKDESVRQIEQEWAQARATFAASTTPAGPLTHSKGVS